MLRKIVFKKKICIDDANYLFKVISRFEEIRKLKYLNKIKNKPFLFLSNLFERNIFGNEYKQLDTMFFIGLKNSELTNKLDLLLTNNQRLAFRVGKLIRGNLVFNKKFAKDIFKNIFIFFVRFLKSIIDILLLIIVSLIFYFKRKSHNYNVFEKIQELYTITYSRKISQERDLIKYFYPDFDERPSKCVFITDYDGVRFISLGIIDSYNNNNFLSILDFILPKDIIVSLINLIQIYTFELFKKSIFKYGSIFSIINSLQNINRRYFSLLIYHTSKKLIKYKAPQNIFAWGEGLSSDKGFILGVNNFIKNNKLDSVKLYSYIATPISSNYYPHYLPSYFDLECGLWSRNFLVYDSGSLNEMKEFSNKKGLNIKIEKIRQGMYRLKNINVNRNEFKVERYLTFFTHGSIHELFLMLVSFYQNIYRNPRYKNNLNLIYFRLHPLLDNENLKSQIYKLQNIFDFEFPEYISIPLNNEDMQTSLLKTEYSFFGESAYVNYAIKNNIKVINTRTSFIFETPIHTNLIRKSNIENIF